MLEITMMVITEKHLKSFHDPCRIQALYATYKIKLYVIKLYNIKVFYMF